MPTDVAIKDNVRPIGFIRYRATIANIWSIRKAPAANKAVFHLVGESDMPSLGPDPMHETYPPPSTIEGNYIN